MPLWGRLAEDRGRQAPDVLEETLQTAGYVTGCPGCRRISHVIGHPAAPGP
jgi:Tfp pilus assembly protein PilW